MATVVILMGAEGTGKSTLAEYLVAHHGFQEYTFAGILRTTATAMWNDIAAMLALPHITVADTISHTTKDKQIGAYMLAGRPFTPRALLQWFGTDVMRKHVSEDIWVRAMLDAMTGAAGRGCRRFVISDCRFPNELAVTEAHLKKSLPGCRIVRVRLVRNQDGIVELNALASAAGSSHISNRGWMDLPADMDIINPMTSRDSWLASVARRLGLS